MPSRTSCPSRSACSGVGAATLARTSTSARLQPRGEEVVVRARPRPARPRPRRRRSTAGRPGNRPPSRTAPSDGSPSTRRIRSESLTGTAAQRWLSPGSSSSGSWSETSCGPAAGKRTVSGTRAAVVRRDLGQRRPRSACRRPAGSPWRRPAIRDESLRITASQRLSAPARIVRSSGHERLAARRWRSRRRRRRPAAARTPVLGPAPADPARRPRPSPLLRRSVRIVSCRVGYVQDCKTSSTPSSTGRPGGVRRGQRQPSARGRELVAAGPLDLVEHRHSRRRGGQRACSGPAAGPPARSDAAASLARWNADGSPAA